MEPDTHRTFRDIFGSEDAFVTQMLKLERSLVHKVPNQNSHSLRFIKLKQNMVEQGASHEVHLELTPMGQHSTADCYIAVSYTWEQSQVLENTFAHIIPKYILWTSEHSSRPLRCPPLVLHRALETARHRLAEPLIWIDQECIIQDDPSDVENHLQIMHEVYIRSDLTVAILSSLFIEQSWFDEVRAIMSSPPTQEQLLKSPETLPATLRLLQCILDDRWSTRTWAYQEWYCASNLCYLLPVAPSLSRDPHDTATSSAQNPQIDLSIPDMYLHLLIKAYSSLPSSLPATERSNAIEDFNGQSNHMHVENSNANDTSQAIRHLSSPLLNRFVSSQRHQGHMPTKHVLPHVFAHMQTCNNLVFTDRLAILANMFNFSWRLRSRDVNSGKFSFSACVLALLVGNREEMGDTGVFYRRDEEVGEDRGNRGERVGRWERRVRGVAKRVMDVSVLDVVDDLTYLE